MIIKSLSRKSNPSQLIQYATRYIVKDHYAKDKQQQMKMLVRHNLRSKTVEGIIAEFKENESYRLYRRKDSVVLFHSILSIAPGDKEKVSAPMLKDLSNKFIELRGNCLHLAVAHLEKKHAHVHIISSGVQVNGRSSRVSKPAFQRMLNTLEKYQQERYPELIHSKNSHEKASDKSKERLIAHLTKTRSNKKLELNHHLSNAVKNAKSYDDFITLLSIRDYQPYYRNARLQGILSAGRKYRFSSLGFEREEIEALRENEKTKALTELQAIRNRGREEKEIIKRNREEPAESGKENNLASIVSVRERAKSIGGMERAFEPSAK